MRNMSLNDLYSLFYDIYDTDYYNIINNIISSNETLSKKINMINECIHDINEYISILEEYKKAYTLALDDYKKKEEEQKKKLEEIKKAKEAIKKENIKKNEPKYSIYNYEEPKKPFVKTIQLQYVDSIENDTYTDYITPSGKAVRVYKK